MTPMARLSKSSTKRREKFLEIVYTFEDVNKRKNFTVYTDLYFEGNRTLSTLSLKLSDYVQTCNASLISGSSVVSDFMPCFSECFGLLQILKYSRDSSDTSFNLYKSFTNYCPIFKCYSWKTRVVYFGELLSRLSLHCQPVRRKPMVSLIDLDEISPVEDDNPRITDDLIVNPVERPLLEKNRFNPIILDPLSLEIIQKKRVINRLYETEQRKLVRITIMYTLAFFALALTTFFIIYLA